MVTRLLLVACGIVQAVAFAPAPDTLALARCAKHVLSTRVSPIPAKRRSTDTSPRPDKEVAEEEKKTTTAFSKDKLVAETQAPFRKVRLFLYGGFAFSAFIGGLTALSQLAAAVADRPDSLPLKDCLINVGVDFSVLAVCAFAIKFEGDTQKELEEMMAKRREAKRREACNKIDDATNAARIGRLRELTVRLNVDGDGAQREAAVGTLMASAQQDIVIVAGGPDMVRDALLGAMLVKDQVFSGRNLLIVPVTTAGSDKGFAAKPAAFRQGFVAEPAGADEDGWRSLIAEELEDARRQGNEAAAKQGIVLVVRRDGAVLRRGVGQPKWHLIRDDLDPASAKDKD
ncbi:unnamed protein product [Phaeothamnion confervicola]